MTFAPFPTFTSFPLIKARSVFESGLLPRLWPAGGLFSMALPKRFFGLLLLRLLHPVACSFKMEDLFVRHPGAPSPGNTAILCCFRRTSLRRSSTTSPVLDLVNPDLSLSAFAPALPDFSFPSFSKTSPDEVGFISLFYYPVCFLSLSPLLLVIFVTSPRPKCGVQLFRSSFSRFFLAYQMV